MSGSKQGSLDRLADSIWKTMKSMRFAIIILVILAIASIVNLFAQEFISQARGDSDQIYQVYESMYGKIRADLIMFFQMYNPYRSWWYTLLLGLITVSLLICAIDRAPIVYRMVFRPSFRRDPASYATVPNMALKGRSGLSASVVDVLRSANYRVRQETHGDRRYISGDKYSWARSGSWFVHIGLLLLIIGAAMIARGEIRYRVQGLPGDLLAESEDFWKFNLRIDDFIVEYYPLAVNQLVEVDGRILGRVINQRPDGTYNVETYRPSMDLLNSVEAGRISNRIDTRSGNGKRLDIPNISDYIAVLTIIENGREVGTKRVEVNAPLRYKGFRFYQSSFDDGITDSQGRWTTILEVRKDRGSVFVLIGILIFSFGLIIGMYIVPRQMFALVQVDDEGELILLAGKITRNRSIFQNEFERLVGKIRQSAQVNSEE